MKTNVKTTTKPDQSFTLSFNVTVDEIKKEYHRTLSHVAANFETKGFRKGKAPLDVVKNSISAQNLLDEVVNHILSEKYDEIIKENKLKPATQPAVKILNPPFDLDKNWQIEISGAQIPEITVDPKAYIKIKKINADTKIDKEKHTNQIITTLLDHTTIEISQIITDYEVKHNNKTTTQATDEWKLNLAINQIATEQKLDPTPEEVKEIVTKNPKLAQNPNLVVYLLTQQKVINYLLSIL